MPKPTVTIGIPAFNEQANIGFLLESILKQQQEGFIIEKIIVASDGSTDNTNKIVRGFKRKNIMLIANKERLGQGPRNNQIIERTKSDCLVLLNADIAIIDKSFLTKLISPILKEGADLTSVRPLGVKPKKFFEKIVFISLLIRDFMYESYRNGQSIYTCWGAGRGFSKKFYQEFRFKDSIGEDAYSYLYCESHGFIYNHVSSARCYIKLASNFSDHAKQSIRNIQTLKKYHQEFGKAFVEKEYGGWNILYGMTPRMVTLGVLYSLFRSPIYTLLFLFIATWMRIKSLGAKTIPNTWSMSNSTRAAAANIL